MQGTFRFIRFAENRRTAAFSITDTKENTEPAYHLLVCASTSPKAVVCRKYMYRETVLTLFSFGRFAASDLKRIVESIGWKHGRCQTPVSRFRRCLAASSGSDAEKLYEANTTGAARQGRRLASFRVFCSSFLLLRGCLSIVTEIRKR